MPEVYPFEKGAEAFPFIRRAFHPPATSCGAYIQSWRLEDGSEVVIERGDLTRTGPCMVYFYGPHEPRLNPPEPTARQKSAP